jgi:ATP-dependent DNA helicase RecG
MTQSTHPEPPKNRVVPTKSFPQKALQKLGLIRDIDLALHLPFRYEDETRVVLMRNAPVGCEVQLDVVVTHCEIKTGQKRQLLIRAEDNTGSCLLRFFNFYPSQQKMLTVGTRLLVRGEVKHDFGELVMLHPQFRIAGGELPKHLTPIYPVSVGLSQVYLRKVIHSALARLDLREIFSTEQLTACGPASDGAMWGLRDSLHFLHYPTPSTSLLSLENHSHHAWTRLKVEELLAQQLSQLLHRRKRQQLQAPQWCAPKAINDTPLDQLFMQQLPFALTKAQQRVSREIAKDLAATTPMHRLLQGDVGSGKTVVAALAACVGIQAGWQCALMAPTELLVEQHLRKLVLWLAPLGIQVAWLFGTQKAKERQAMLAQIENGTAQLVIGTHAVIQKKVRFHNLGLAIIDEQHRFGVAQRLALRQKMEDERIEPHLLMMTATPIPRTLAMSYYADLDVSTIDELPPGRTPIVTKALHETKRVQLIERIRLQIQAGRQAYWVCPLIEESEVLDLKNAKETHVELSEQLAHVVLENGTLATVGLLHSRMSSEEKKFVMEQFSNGQLALLVCTTVIEVGVDVPNATLMVVEHAERFGLSQLHQLRGRVGRGHIASACVLLYATKGLPKLGDVASARIRAMVETTDGFEISRRDFLIRGPGELLGARQSGASLLRFSDVIEDEPLIAWASRLAPYLLDNFPEQALLHIDRWVGIKTDYLWA